MNDYDMDETAPRRSPWGAPDHADPLGPHVWTVSTPSHGGFKVSNAGMSKIAPRFRQTACSKGGWFEEDCDWCIPYLALDLHQHEPDRGERMREQAIRTLAHWHNAKPEDVRA